MNTKHLDTVFEVKELKEDGTFSGYGSVFDTIDSYAERVAKGAFKESIKQHTDKKSAPALLWQHDTREPIGVWTSMKEDDRGLYMEGKLATTGRAKEAHELLQMGAIKGLSIGFIPKKWEDDDEGIRTLTEIDLWETSLVTFPANPDAQVEAVKSRTANGELPTIREFERFLMRDAGFSRSQSREIINSGFKSLMQDAEQPKHDAGLEDLEKLNSLLEEFNNV